MKKIFKKLFLFITALFIFVNITFADTPKKATPPPIIPVAEDTVKIKIPHKNPTIQENDFLQKGLIPGITATIVSITGGLSLLFVIIGGLQMLLSFGDPEKFGKGRKIITWALVGLVISMLSYAVVAIIASIKV